MAVDPNLIATMQANGELPPGYSKVDPGLLSTMLDHGELTLAASGNSYTLTESDKLKRMQAGQQHVAELKADVANSEQPSAFEQVTGIGPRTLPALGEGIKSGAQAVGDWLSTAQPNMDGTGLVRPPMANDNSHDLFPRTVDRSGQVAAGIVGNTVKGAGNLAVGIPAAVGTAASDYGKTLASGITTLAAGNKATDAQIAGAVGDIQQTQQEFGDLASGMVGGPNGIPAKSIRAVGYLQQGNPELARATMGNIVNHIGPDAYNDPATFLLNVSILHGLGVAGIGAKGALLQSTEAGLRDAAAAAAKAGDHDAAAAATAKANELANARGVMAQARAAMEAGPIQRRANEAARSPRIPSAETASVAGPNQYVDPLAEGVGSSYIEASPAEVAEIAERGRGVSPHVAAVTASAGSEPQEPTELTPAEEPVVNPQRLVQDFPVSDIKADPERFQYKILSGKGGQTGSLSDAKAWNPTYGGVLHVWRDPADDQVYAVNGHNRLALAQRTGTPTVDVHFLDAATAEDAKTQGALINIAEGQGTALDAAKLFRDKNYTPEDIQRSGLPMTGEKARQGMALSNLATPLFNSAMRGELPIERAAIIGDKLPRMEDQLDLVKLIDQEQKRGRNISNATVAELADQIASGPSVTDRTASLFGEDETVRSTALQRAEVAAYVRQNLNKEGNVFNIAAKNADRLAKGGNTIKAEESARIALQSKQGAEIFDRFKNVPGPVSDILNEAAGKLATGKENANGIKQEALDKLNEALPDILRGISGRADETGASPGATAGGDGGAVGEQPTQEGPGLDFGTRTTDLSALPNANSNRIPVSPLAGGTAKGLSNIVMDLGKGIGRRVDVNRLPVGAAGRYRATTAHTSIRFAGDLDTTAHEIAHALSDKHGIGRDWQDNDKPSPYDAELKPFWENGGSATSTSTMAYKREEGLAEWIRAYVVNPDEAVRRAPNVAAHVLNTISLEDGAALHQFSNQVRQFAGLPAAEKIRANIAVDSRPTLTQKFIQYFRGQGWDFETRGQDTARAKWFDSLHPYTRAIEAARRINETGPLLPEDDPLVLARLHAGIGGKIETVLDRGMIDAKGKQVTPGGLSWLMEPFDRSTTATIKRDMADASAYGIAERVVERAGLLRDEATAKSVIARGRIQSMADRKITDMAETLSERAERQKALVTREETARKRATITERQSAIRQSVAAVDRLSLTKARSEAELLSQRIKNLHAEMEASVASARQEAMLRAEKSAAVSRVRSEGEVKARVAVNEAVNRERARVERQDRSTVRGKNNVTKRRQAASDRGAVKIITPELFEMTRKDAIREQRGGLAADNAEARIRAAYEKRLDDLHDRASLIENRIGSHGRSDATAAIDDMQSKVEARTDADMQRRHDAIDRRHAELIQRRADRIQAEHDRVADNWATRSRARAEHKITRLSGIGGGLTSDEVVAHQAIRDIEADPKRLAMVKEATTRYRKWADALLRYQVDKGVLSEKSYETIKERNEYYTAMMRDVEKVSPAGRGAGGRLGSGRKLVHTFEGSQRTILDPYQALLDKTYDTIKEADRNEALVKFRDLLTSDRAMHQGPVRNLAAIGREVKAGEPDTIKIKVRHVDKVTGEESIKEESWQFEQGVYKALKGFTSEPIMIPALLRVVPQVMRQAVTHFPAFLARNVVRDYLDRVIKSESGSGFRDMFGVTPAERRGFAISGGDQAGHYMRSRENFNKVQQVAMEELAKNGRNVVMDGAVNALRRYQNLARGSELANRMAEYKAAYRHATTKLGYDEYNAQLYAASQARGLMDFAIAGEYGRIVNQIIPFSNAALQGSRMLFQSARRNPAVFAGRWATYIVAPTIAVYLWNRAQGPQALKEYQQLPQYQRDLFWNLKVAPDTWLRIPKGFEVAVFAAGVERSLDRAMGNKNAFEGYSGTVARNLLPLDESAIAGTFKAFLETEVNYSYFKGRNIVPPEENQMRLEMRRGKAHSSAFGQALGKVMNVDPRKVDYLAGAQLGGFGQLAGSRSLEDALMTTSGFFTHSPALAAPDVQATMNAAASVGLRDPLKGSQLEYYAAMDHGSAQSRDVAARNLRDRASVYRPLYEAISDRLAKSASQRRK